MASISDGLEFGARALGFAEGEKFLLIFVFVRSCVCSDLSRR